jgi:hypothetical protein
LFWLTSFRCSDASDIPDGDWETAKLEVARLRALINKVIGKNNFKIYITMRYQVDCAILDDIEEREEELGTKHRTSGLPNPAALLCLG